MKAARKLTRRISRVSSRTFLAEGRQAVREAIAHGDCVIEVYVAPDPDRHADLVSAAGDADVPVVVVDDAALAAISDTVAPQGIVALCRFVDVPLEDAWGDDVRLVAVCAHVRDPGNAGVVIRCADAAGADAVVLAGDSVDPYNGKAVRASVGSLFHLPVVTGVSVQEAVDRLRHDGVRVLAADGGSGLTLDDAQVDARLAEPTAWVFGNEAWGLPEVDSALADAVVGIPIYGAAESLNLATAAAVCLYTSARAQRR